MDFILKGKESFGLINRKNTSAGRIEEIIVPIDIGNKTDVEIYFESEKAERNEI